jgi:RNA polymerase sigma factor (sigma-70 family)
MEVSALRQPGITLRGPTPLLRLQSDERLVALTRRGNQAAFESLVGRYQARLLSFCRHMLGSREDAEDVLQEVFAAAFNAMVADERPINVRPWLYRIARNRSLNHLRRHQAIGVDSMDVHFAENGTSTADKVHKREEFRQLMGDVQGLPETQRTALLLREIDALSYDQIAEAMETTVPSVKSLLVRARVSLAEAAEARRLSCDEVRLELGEVAEGLRRTSPPVRRHLRSCDHCSTFRRQLRETNRALAAVFPVGPVIVFKKLLLTHLGTTASAGGATAAASTAAAGTASIGTGGALSAGVGAIASKTAASLAAAALVTAGAVEVDHAAHHRLRSAPRAVQAAVAPAAPAAAAVPAAPAQVVTQPVEPKAAPAVSKHKARAAKKEKDAAAKDKKAAATPVATTPAAPATTTPAAPTTQEESDTTVLPPQDGGSGQPVGPGRPVDEAPPPDPQQSQQQPPPSAQQSAGQDQYQPAPADQPQQQPSSSSSQQQSAGQNQYSDQSAPPPPPPGG